ncbi:putative prohead core protein [Pelagibacter phage Mosig EXVC030M]|nr:putative prohead core protein [Pelagibacter phage Mosig EXVC030M]
MADTEKKLEALEQEAVAEANAQADAPKKNAVAAEPNHLKNDAEDLGAAVVKPTDSNPDATKKVKQVSGDAQQKSQGSADPMPKLSGHNTKLEGAEAEEGSEEIKEGEMPKAALDALKKHKEKSEDKDADKKDEKEVKEMDHMDKDKKKMEPVKAGYMKSSYKMKKEEVDEHMDALVAGQDDLSEEFKTKAATVFESAVNSKVKEIAEQMEADVQTNYEQDIAEAKEALTEKVDSYLSYVVEEWMKENEIALERGIKGEIAEDFITGLKKLFAEHYIDVPDERYNVLEDQAAKIESLEKKLNEQIEKNVELNKENAVKSRKEIMAEVASDLADTSKEKFAKLAEEIEWSDADSFKSKCETIKESYFGVKKEEVKDELHDVAAGDEASNEDLSKAMAAYTAAISKTKDIKIS